MVAEIKTKPNNVEAFCRQAGISPEGKGLAEVTLTAIDASQSVARLAREAACGFMPFVRHFSLPQLPGLHHRR